MTQTIVECPNCSNKCSCYYNHLNYRLEQLVQKTQECEELKAYAQRQENQRETYYKEFLKKDKALEEIEKVINNIFSSCLGHKTKGCTPVHNVCEELIKMLNIIGKAKEYKSD